MGSDGLLKGVEALVPVKGLGVSMGVRIVSTWSIDLTSITICRSETSIGFLGNE